MNDINDDLLPYSYEIYIMVWGIPNLPVRTRHNSFCTWTVIWQISRNYPLSKGSSISRKNFFVVIKSWNHGDGSRNQGDFQDISYGLILYFVFMGCHILQMQPIAQSDGEIAVMNVICIYGIVNFRQAEVVTGIKHHILVFVREADWYTEVYRL